MRDRKVVNGVNRTEKKQKRHLDRFLEEEDHRFRHTLEQTYPFFTCLKDRGEETLFLA